MRLVLLSLKDFKGKVVLGRNKSRDFTVGTGVKQGDALSATLFILVLHYAINKIDFRGHIFKRTRQLGAYADDIVLVARNKNVLKDTFIEMEREVSKIGLEVNEAKTKYMKVSAKENRDVYKRQVVHVCVMFGNKWFVSELIIIHAEGSRRDGDLIRAWWKFHLLPCPEHTDLSLIHI